jgi:Ca-activated chloride channel homolog
MDLRWPWLAVLVLLGVPVVLWLSTRRFRLPVADGLFLAHVHRLRTLPRYRVLARRQVLWAALQVAAVLVVLLGAALLAGRPTTTGTEDPAAQPGDLLLCLDVSPSMHADNLEVLGQVRQIVDDLDGERIGLYVFSQTTADLMPLTDDYGYAKRRLHDVQEAFEELNNEYLAGTSAEGGQPARVGDGLVSCAQHFDRPEGERGRALVLSSANEGAPAPVYTLGEAGRYAAGNGIVVYGLAARSTGEGLAEFRTSLRPTGGRVLALGSRGGVTPLAQIRQLERRRLDPPPVPVRDDDPGEGSLLVLGGLGLVLLGGLRELR